MVQKQRNKKTNNRSARPGHYTRPSLRRSTYKPQRNTKKRNRQIIVISLVLLVVCIGVGLFAVKTARDREAARRAQLLAAGNGDNGPSQWQQEGAPYIDVQLLTPNPYSRPQMSIENVNYIAIHYTANPGATAQANRNYFENLAQTQETKVSSHFVVGLEGETIQCIPTSEMSYATNERNVDTISIECCHPDETGILNGATYETAVKLTAWLCTRFGLTEENVIRHYDVTGKNCPRYFVEHEDAWMQMKADIAVKIAEDYVLQENLQ